MFGYGLGLLLLPEITREVVRVLRCWCYEQHQSPTNSRDGIVPDRLDLSQYTHQLSVIGCFVRPYLA
jgi:hypothetical protein